MSGLREFVDVLRAAGENTRLRLLALLANGELSVKDLTEILDQSQPRISRHLRLLCEAGLATRHAEGAWAYFRLSDDPWSAELVTALLARLDEADPILKGDRDRLEAVRIDHQNRASAYFAKVASNWDRIRGLHLPEADVNRAIFSLIENVDIDDCLDLGTGTGRMLEVLSPHFKRGVGIDSSREMIAVARANIEKAGIRNAQIRLGDITALDAFSETADLVVLHQVLHYFDDPGRALRYARATLKPGGHVLIVDFAPHNLEFLREQQAHRRLGLSEAQMAQWARLAEMEVKTVETLPPVEGREGLTVCVWLLADNR
ncbi:ArsR/SmtB family transcription factor [Cucumibacter marinus]|uniref:ArsR/SmtB family transcription factor n=1 Tax=Cucumibacter marinus TaxID=1121252 RepID=UPI0003FBDA7F|nr:metalloregulator ArsR/SmtB family transcription factor [Cucumibacter marinus]